MIKYRKKIAFLSKLPQEETAEQVSATLLFQFRLVAILSNCWVPCHQIVSALC